MGDTAVLTSRRRQLCNFEKVQHVQDLINESISEDAVWAKTPVDLRHQRYVKQSLDRVPSLELNYVQSDAMQLKYVPHFILYTASDV